MPIDLIAPARASRSRARMLRWTALGVFAAGLALRECVLLAASALVALQAFDLHMAAAAPWQGWRAAARCAVAGLAGLFAAGGLLAGVAGAWWGWWTPHTDQPLLALFVLAVAALACWNSHPRADLWGIGNPLAMLAAGVALLSAAIGWPVADCLFTAVAAAAVGRIGWTLLSSTASDLAIADGRS